MLNTKSKESIKTALAMVMAYGISLSLDWDRPYWAGFAVAFVSLASIGQSMNKAALRMLGTILAVGVSLTLIALFAQDRWAFISALSLYAGLCCYLMSGSKHPYFWQVSGFVVVIICMDAGPNPVNAFQTAVLRAQQTGLGIIVYSLVAIFLWPSSSRGAFRKSAIDLAGTQLLFYRACVDLSRGDGTAQEAHRVAVQVMQAKTRFDQLLDAAEIDSTEVWDARFTWRSFQLQAKELIQDLERWRISMGEAGAMELVQLLPGIEGFYAELDQRLDQVASQLKEGQARDLSEPADLSPEINGGRREISHSDKALIALAKSNMKQLDALTRSMIETTSALGVSEAVIPAPDAPSLKPAFGLPDIDRLAHAFRLVVIMWVIWLAMIFVPDMPGGTGLLAFGSSLGIAIVQMPQMGVSKLFMPAAVSVLFAGFNYIFLMPTLSSYTELALVIFLATFAICYLFSDPAQMLGRAMGLAMFVTIASISNEQSYSFLSFANTALMFPIIFLVFACTAYIPWSSRPERSILRMLKRFFDSSDYILGGASQPRSRAASRLEPYLSRYHATEVATLPEKINALTPFLDDWVLTRVSKEQIQKLVTSLQLLGYRLEQLQRESGKQGGSDMAQYLFDDLQAWRSGMRSTLRKLSQGPTTEQHRSIQQALDDTLLKLDRKLDVLDENSSDARYDEQSREDFYRLLAAYRGTSEALLDYMEKAVAVDWAPWRQERFL